MKTQLPRTVMFEDFIRGLLVFLYLTIIVVCFTTQWGPRIFWTMALPLLVIAIVLMGYNTWRRICPLAFWGSLGVRFRTKAAKSRRVPEWMERWFFVISLSFLVVMLIVRLVVINGDGIFLGITLILMGALAAFTNFFYSGRVWCNFLCPVSTVERIYTDPNSLRGAGNSQCAKCTACKRHCPDIDQENAYWKDVTLPSRRIAFYSFPGIVLGFYTYYYLRAGEWAAYYDGRWTRHTFDWQLVLGPGFFFAPQIPAVLAALLTMLTFIAVSYLIFLGLENILLRFQPDAERARHLSLSLAAFTAFNIFYLFAGAPTLRLIPGGTRIVAFIVPFVSALFLYKRWRRQSDDYIKVKSAKHLLPLWKFKTPPPQDPSEVFAYFQGHNEAHTAQVAAYEEVVREILADGIITQRELSLLNQMRASLNINDTEHRKIFSALSEEDRNLLNPANAITVERQLQRQGYKTALAQLLMRKASTEELAALRLDYGIEPEIHETILKELRGDTSLLMDRIRKQIDRLTNIRSLIAALSPLRTNSLRTAFVIDILFKSQEQYVGLIKDALSALGDAQFQDQLAKLTSADQQEQASAWEFVRNALGAEFAAKLRSMFEFKAQPISADDSNPLYSILESLLASPDVYHRASAALILTEQTDDAYAKLLHRCVADEHPLVRETTERAIRQSDSSDTFTDLCTLEKMLFLHQVPLFADLNPDDLYELSQLSQEVTLHVPDLLVQEGDDADHLYVITAGKTETSITRNGKNQVIGTAGPGNVIGEMSVIDRQARSATVRAASSEVQLLHIDGEAFRRVLASRPDLSAQIMRIISLRLRQILSAM